MAVQNTNSAAYNQLRPLEGNSLGAINEEHIRYWKKYDDDAEALAKAQKAQQDEYARKLAESQGKDYDTLLSKLKLEDSDGYKREQIVGDFNSKREYLGGLAKQAAMGDEGARLKYYAELDKYKELTSLDKTMATVGGTNLKGGRDAADFNPATDEPIMKMLESFIDGQYMVKNGDLVIPDPQDPTRTIKKNPSEIKNFLLGAKFSGKFEPTVFGNTIAGTIKLDDDNGNRRLTKDIENTATIKTLNAFEQNDVALRSYAFQMKNSEEENNPYANLDINNLSKNEITSLSKKFAEDEVLKNLQKSNNWINNAGKLKAIEEDRADTVNLRLDTETGKPLKTFIWQGKPTTLKDNEYVFGLDGKEDKTVIDTQGRTIVPNAVLFNSEGKLVIGGKVTEETYEDVRDGSGKIIYDEYANEKGEIVKREARKQRVVKVTGDAEINDDKTLGEVVTKMTNPNTGKKYKNTTEFKEVQLQKVPVQATQQSGAGDSIFNQN
jgi:hypothetical protein